MMTGRQLTAVLAAIVVFTVVVPPWAARDLHHRRIARATATTQALARSLAPGVLASADAARAAGHAPLVWSGAGLLPDVLPGVTWPARHAILPALAETAADPWGNNYVVAVSADPARPTVVASAGPDSHFSTPLGATTQARGDDILAAIPHAR